MNKIEKSEFRKNLTEIGTFFGSVRNRKLEKLIRTKKPIFRLVFFVARYFSTSQVGASLMIVIAALFYPQLRFPTRADRIFLFGMSKNNERSFRRLNTIMCENPDWAFDMNSCPISFRQRISWLRWIDIWQSAGILKAEGDASGFLRVQQALGLASLIIFTYALMSRRPKMLVVANDHSPIYVAIRQATQKVKVPVVYIQHAPVNETFPPLKFDLSILNDLISYDFYEQSASINNVDMSNQILFLPPFESRFTHPTLKSGPIRVGMALSLLPNLDVIGSFLEELQNNLAVSSIQIRRHPRCAINLDGLTKHPKISARDPGESLEIFLGGVDLIIVSNSGITVECLHAGKPVFFLDGGDNMLNDPFGLMRNEIIPTYNQNLLEDREMISSFFDASWKIRFSKFNLGATENTNELKQKLFDGLSKLLSKASKE